MMSAERDALQAHSGKLHGDEGDGENQRNRNRNDDAGRQPSDRKLTAKTMAMASIKVLMNSPTASSTTFGWLATRWSRCRPAGRPLPWRGAV